VIPYTYILESPAIADKPHRQLFSQR